MQLVSVASIRALSRAWRRRFVWVFVVLLLATATAELGLRMAFGLGRPPLMQADTEVGYLFQGDQDLWRFGRHVKINHYHQRSDDVTPQPAEGTVRVFAIGDSITFGGVELDSDQPFPAVLQTRLRADGVPAQVLNASAGSWAIGNERAYIEKFGNFGSQVAVLEIGSDDLVQRTSTSAPVGVDPAYPDHNPPAALWELFQRYLVPRLAGTAGPRPATRAEEEAQFPRNMDEFAREVALLRAVGTSVIVVHPPVRDEVVAGVAGVSTYYSEYRARFRALADRLEVPVIDLSAEWLGRPGAAGYYRDGTHLSVLGCKVLGERLAPEVKKLIERAQVTAR